MNQGLHSMDHVGDLIAEVGQRQDDQPEDRPHDTETRARCLLRLRSISGVVLGSELDSPNSGGSYPG
jgi:hypothetical protein